MDKKNLLSIKDIQALILPIMKDIDKFCRSNDIRYAITCGTLLGAVRNGGFIPWDDDADIFMLREDFDRFVSSYKSEKFKLVYNFDDKQRFPSGIAKVGDTSTYQKDATGTLDFGAWVDIFPLDAVPGDPKKCYKFMHKLMSINNRIYHRCHKDIVSILKSYRHSLAWWLNRLNETIQNNPYNYSPFVAHAIGAEDYSTVIPKAWFDSLTDVIFEGYKFKSFKDADSYLSMAYGPDYMIPRKRSHDIRIYRNE